MSGSWTTENVGGHPVDVYVPPTRNELGYVVIYLHGVHLNHLRDHPPFIEQFDKHGLPVVCPQTKRSWWTDRVCEEFDTSLTAERHLLDNVVPFVEERFGSIPPRIGLLGTSMGGQGALRFSYKYPQKFPVVAAISPAVDYQNRVKNGDEVLAAMYRDAEQARQETALLYVNPLNWPRHQFFCCCPHDTDWFESADRLQMKLGSMGIPHTYEFDVEGGGHGFEYYNLMAERAVTFIHDGLEQERRRIV